MMFINKNELCVFHLQPCSKGGDYREYMSPFGAGVIGSEFQINIILSQAPTGQNLLTWGVSPKIKTRSFISPERAKFHAIPPFQG